jgi:PhnB protein
MGTATKNVKPVPEGVPVVIPRLVCRDPSAMINFCVTVFGAKEMVRRPGPDGSIAHALVTISNSMLMIEAEWPQMPNKAPKPDGSSPVILFIYVENVDEAVQRGVDQGATILMPLQNQFWGDRTAWIMDPGGHVWTVASRIEETTAEERDRRFKEG